MDQLIQEGDKKTILETLSRADVEIVHSQYYEFMEKDRKFYKDYVKILRKKNIFDYKTWCYCFTYRENFILAEELFSSKEF